MTIAFDGENTTLYQPVKDGSGAPTDQVGSRDLASLVGGTHDAEGIVLDGVNDFISSDTVTSGKFPIDVAGDYTFYLYLKTLSQIGAVAERWLRTNVATGVKGPIIQNCYSCTLGYTKLFSNASANAIADIDAARDVNVDEYHLILGSWKASTTTINGVYRSDQGHNFSDSGTGTGATNTGSDTLTIGKNVSVFSNFNFIEMGVINGTAKTLQELIDAGENWVNPPATGSGIILPAIKKIITPAIEKIF